MSPGASKTARWARLCAGLLPLLLIPTVALGAGFEDPVSPDTSQQFVPVNPQREDTPNDPDYDRAEIDDEDRPGSPRVLGGGPAAAPSTNLYDERFDLFGFPSPRTPLALYLEGPHTGNPMVSGFNAAGAWKLTRGSPSVAVAILDTGIKWDREGLRTQIRLNTGELPPPDQVGATCPSQGSDPYDCNGDGVFNVADYEGSTRQPPPPAPTASAQLDAEDLIATLLLGPVRGRRRRQRLRRRHRRLELLRQRQRPDRHARATSPPPTTAPAARPTRPSRATTARARSASARTARSCPMRIWDTFVSDANAFALGILYATDNGAKVIEGANGSLYHSAFAEAASQYAYDHGVVQTFSGDDLNTGNHNYPANYGHAMLIQGTVPDTVGLGRSRDQSAEGRRLCLCGSLPRRCRRASAPTLPVGTFFRGANTTQYGGKSSISMEGATGSENTSKAAGRRRRWSSAPASSHRRSRCAPTRRARCSSRPPSAC